jgi:hypothetical protein
MSDEMTPYIKCHRTKAEAIETLTKRYYEQCERYPRTAEIGLALYLRRNVHGAMTYYRKRDEN